MEIKVSNESYVERWAREQKEKQDALKAEESKQEGEGTHGRKTSRIKGQKTTKQD